MTGHLNGASAALDESEVLRWDLMKAQTTQYLMTAVLALATAASLIRHTFWRTDPALLPSFGFTPQDLKKLSVLRVLFGVLLSFIHAVILYIAL